MSAAEKSKKAKKNEKNIQALVVGIIVSLFMILLHFTGALDALETVSADSFRTSFSSAKSSGKIVHVMFTETCLTTKAKQEGLAWPWPREGYAIMLDFLKKRGAKAVVFDMIFSEHSRYGVADDKKFIDAIKRFGTVIFGSTFDALSTDKTAMRKLKAASADTKKQVTTRQREVANLIKQFALNVTITDPNITMVESFKATPPHSEYLSALSGIGNVVLTADKDGSSRRKRLLLKHQDKFFPDLSLSIIQKILEIKNIEIAKNSITLIQSNKQRIVIPTDDRGYVLLNFPDSYYKAYSKRNIQYLEVLASDLIDAARDPNFAQKAFKPGSFKDKIIIFGTHAPGLWDLRVTPFGRKEPGAFLYSTLIDNILMRDFLTTQYSFFYLLILVLIFSFLTALIGAKLSAFKGVLVTIGIAIAYIIFAALLLSLTNTLVYIASVIVTILISFIAGLVVNYVRESKQKKFIQGAFSQVLAPAILEKLMADPTTLGLGGESKELTIFFSDLQGFTTFSEELGSPQKVVNVLNEYLTAMSDIIIMDYNGYVDKYEGDAIMAYWGAPVEDSDHAWKGCYAALDNQKRMVELQAKFHEMGLKSGLKVRIGLNTGIAHAGMMGSLKKLNYTIIGDSVNLASRLEGANKMYGTLIMISDATRQAAGDKILVRPLDLIRVKGKTEPTRVYELVAKLGEATQQQQDLIDLFGQAVESYSSMDFAKAKTLFEKTLSFVPDDSPSQKYIERCEMFIQSPPPQPWDGVFTMTTK